MLTVGNLLKKAREHSGKQVEEIAQIIRIKPEYLHKIEANDFTTFNSSTFVKGFIRSYASFLGLDSENIVALFRRQIGEEDTPLKAKQTLVKQKAVVISPTAIISVAIIVFFVGIFGFLLSQFYQLQQPPELKLVQPAQAITTVDTVTYEIKGIIEENSLLTVNGTQLQIKEDNTFSLLLELKEGDNSFTFDAWKKNVEGKHATQIVTLVYTPKGKPSLTATPVTQTDVQGTTGNNKEVTVQLQLSKEAWIQVVADSTQKAVGIKEKDYKLTFTAKKSIEITTGKPADSIVKLDEKQFPWKIKNGVGSLVCSYDENVSDWKCSQ